jgi:hypothetical protein
VNGQPALAQLKAPLKALEQKMRTVQYDTIQCEKRDSYNDEKHRLDNLLYRMVWYVVYGMCLSTV